MRFALRILDPLQRASRGEKEAAAKADTDSRATSPAVAVIFAPVHGEMDELCGFYDNKENLACVPELGSQPAQKVCAMYICKMRSPEATPTLPLLAGPGRKAGRSWSGQCAVRQRGAAARRAFSRVRLQRSPRFHARPDASVKSHSTVHWAVQDLAHGRAWQQLVQQRDEAVEQRRRLEASRNELARQQGQFKGLIAKVGAASLRARACRPHPRASRTAPAAAPSSLSLPPTGAWRSWRAR